MGCGGAGAGGKGSNEPALLIKCACSCCKCIPGCILNAGLIAPADKCPYEPLALDERDPFTMDANEFGEKRIMEFISNESEYGDDERALFLEARILLGLGLLSREPSKLNGNSVLANVDAGCNSVNPLAVKYSGDNPNPENATIQT